MTNKVCRIDNNQNNVTCCSSENKSKASKNTYSCEVLVEFRTHLCPPPKQNTQVMQINKAEAKIEKICSGKIIIGGTLHKTIVYTDITQCDCNKANCIKQRDIPFSCYVDIPPVNAGDKFNITENQIICAFSEVIKENTCCCNQSILVEKDIIKITVQKTPAKADSKKMKECRFWGKEVVNSEICFVPAVNPKAASVSVSIDPANFKVKLTCCDLVVVCGFITKTVTFTDGTPTVKKVIPVQVEVTVDVEQCGEVGGKIWIVDKAEVCDSYTNFTCSCGNSSLFHKLVEKDIIAVQIEYV